MSPFKPIRPKDRTKCYYCNKWVKKENMKYHLIYRHKDIYKRILKDRIRSTLSVNIKGLTFTKLLRVTNVDRTTLCRALQEMINNNEVIFYSVSISNKSVVRNPKGIYVYNFKNKK